MFLWYANNVQRQKNTDMFFSLVGSFRFYFRRRRRRRGRCRERRSNASEK